MAEARFKYGNIVAIHRLMKKPVPITAISRAHNSLLVRTGSGMKA
jgi:hypothetical protein